MDSPILSPPATKPHLSVAKLTRFFYVACTSDELTGPPLARVIAGVPLVLFRSQGRAAALIDRCPHRNVPLSLGRMVEGRLECAYHGWQFDCDGVCQKIPGLSGGLVDQRGPSPAEAQRRERRAEACVVREQDGMVWVCPDAGVTPDTEPFSPPRFGDDYARIVRVVEAEGTLHATLENALDVPHTAFLHRGLFRGGKKNQIRAVVRRSPDRVETEYLGEPRPSGIAGRILSPQSGTIEHWDRFILPSVAQVEYKLGQNTHFLVTALCTPVSDFHTRLYGVAYFKTPLPKQMVRAVLEPVALKIFGQDSVMLKHQSDNVRRFGGERFQSTELDFMGPQIWRLLKQAETGGAGEHVVEREVTFWA